jgi:serine/threonine protein kinase/Tfp pilus assembly protein PilF
MRPETDAKSPHPLIRADELISGHRLVRCLGRGGYAAVWEAESPRGERVALKLVQLSSDLRSGELRALEITRGIRHPSLMRVFDTWQVDSLLAISMERADRSLWDRFHEVNAQGLRGIPRPELLGYVRSVADAIDYLNEYRHTIAGQERVGVQHRDLKPQNILLLGDQAKVADFGLARVMEHAVASHTGPCTLPYAAPEYFGGRTSRNSDQYALAVTYCQLRGGGLPFPGSNAQIMFGHLCSPPCLEGLPDPEQLVVARALAKKPEDRWPDCRSFIHALEALGEGQGWPVPDILPGDPPDLGTWHEGVSNPPVLSGSSFSLGSADFEFVSSESFSLVTTGPPGVALGPGDAASPGESPLDLAARDAPGGTIEGPADAEEPDSHPAGDTRIRPRRARLGWVAAASALIVVLSAHGFSHRPERSRLGASASDRTAPRIAPLGSPTDAMRGPLGKDIRPEATNDTPIVATNSEEWTPELAPVSAPEPTEAPVMAAPTQAVAVPREPVLALHRPGGPTLQAPTLAAPESKENESAAPAQAVSVGPGVSEPEALAMVGSGSNPSFLASLRPSGPRPGSAAGSLRSPDLIAPALTPSTPASDRVQTESEPKVAVPPGGSVGDAGRPAQGDPPASRVNVPSLLLPDSVVVRGGEVAKLPIRVRRIDSSTPVHLDFRGLPPGVKAAAAETIPAGTDTADAVLSASVEARPGAAEVTVVVSAGSERGEAGLEVVVLPSNGNLAFERGRAELARGAYDHAILAFDEAIRHDAASFGAYLYRGVANHFRGRYREAVSDYTSAIRARSDSADAYRARARVQIDLGAHRLALEDYTQAIRLRADAKTYLARGCLEHEMGAYDRALVDFDMALLLGPNDPAAHYCRGLTRYVMGENSQAIRDFTEAIRLDSRHTNAYRYRGDAYARLGNDSLASADRAVFERLSRSSEKSQLR